MGHGATSLFMRIRQFATKDLFSVYPKGSKQKNKEVVEQNNLLKEKLRQACLAMMYLLVDVGKMYQIEGLALTTDKKRLVDPSWNLIAKILSSPGKIIQGLRSLKEYILQSAIKPFLLSICKTHL